MQIYNNIFPEEFHQAIRVEGKYAVEVSNGDYYRFIYPSHELAIDVENFLLGAGINHQCDKMFMSKRLAEVPTKYNQFSDKNYAVFIYFINDNYKGGELLYENEVITPVKNRGVYFENTDNFVLTDIHSGIQYLLVSYFRKNSIKLTKTLL